MPSNTALKIREMGRSLITGEEDLSKRNWGTLNKGFVFFINEASLACSCWVEVDLEPTLLGVSCEKWEPDFPGGAVVKNPLANTGDTGSSPGPGKSHMPRSS